MASASAPGKVLLLGEHAVVYGHPALGASIEQRVSVQLEPSQGLLRVTLPGNLAAPPELLTAVGEMARELGVPPRLHVRVQSELPLGGGLGSSAALGVAVARALCAELGRVCDAAEAARLAMHLERAFHGAPSGVDPALCARPGTLLFWRGDPPRIEPVRARPYALAIALTGVARGTRAFVVPLAERRKADPSIDPLLARLGALALEGRTLLETGGLPALGALFDEAHELLSALRVSCAELDRAVSTLRAAGALGAKLTGAGGGGAAIGLARDGGQARELVAALRAIGMEGFVAELGSAA